MVGCQNKIEQAEGLIKEIEGNFYLLFFSYVIYPT